MLHHARKSIVKKPWVGWAVAAGCLGLAAYFHFGRGSGADLYTPESMTEMVTIKFTDTGEEMEIPRGRLDKMLRERGSKLDPTQGVTNPKTGQPTGFPFNKNEWEKWIARINKDKEEAGQLKLPAGKQPVQRRETSITPDGTPAAAPAATDGEKK